MLFYQIKNDWLIDIVLVLTVLVRQLNYSISSSHMSSSPSHLQLGHHSTY